MNYTWIDAHCLGKKGTEKEYKSEWQMFRYMIGGKMYVMMGGDNTGKSIMTVKLDPQFGEHLRSTFKEITPGYYMNKVHWNSMDLNGRVPDDVVRQMIDESYRLVMASLSRKLQKQILDES